MRYSDRERKERKGMREEKKVEIFDILRLREERKKGNERGENSK